MVKFGISNNTFERIAEYTKYSLDSQDSELADLFKNDHDITFLNATSNQAICFGHWLSHPNKIIEATRLVNEELDPVPTSSSDPQFDSYLDSIIFKAIAITGKRQLSKVSGCVLSQTLPALAYDIEKTIKYALEIVKAYERVGVDKSKVVIKILTTWESMQAAKILLEKYGIKSLATVVHSIEQAVIAAEAGCEYVATYVDPLDQNMDLSLFDPTVKLEDNYGYQITVKIHKYYKTHGVKSKLMSAATAGINTIWGLSGIDEMTLPGHMVQKMLLLEIPAEYDLPVLKSSYSVGEGGELMSFIDDKEKYYKSFNKNTIATDRLNFANSAFDLSNEKCKTLITNLLLETGFIED